MRCLSVFAHRTSKLRVGKSCLSWRSFQSLIGEGEQTFAPLDDFRTRSCRLLPCIVELRTANAHTSFANLNRWRRFCGEIGARVDMKVPGLSGPGTMRFPIVHGFK
jgi:hypothetical protein